jgi:hypothetical protein
MSEDPVRFNLTTNLFTYTDSDPVNFVDPAGLGKISFCIKTVKGLWKAVNRSRAAKELMQRGDVLVKGKGAKKGAKQLWDEVFGGGGTHHGPHKAGQRPHYQDPRGGKGHVFYEELTGFTAVGVFGDHWWAQLIDVFNPLSDVLDVLDMTKSTTGPCPCDDEPVGAESE